MIRRMLLSRRTFIAVALLTPAVALYIGFNFYLSSVGTELLSSWLRSEAVEIQEGNLLTSISKNQRVLFSSRYIRGIALFDTSEGKRLMEMGDTVEPISTALPPKDQIRVVNAGFLHKQLLLRPSSRPDTLLIFDVESSLLQMLFYFTFAALVAFVIVLLGSIRFVEKREARRREAYLKNALQDFIASEKPSHFIEQELPSVVKWWNEQKKRLEHMKQQEIRTERMTALAELGARIAHDIRAPLATISSISRAIPDLPPDEKELLERATQRIRDIANEVGDENRSRFLLDHPDIRTSLVESKLETTVLSVVLEELVAEKRVQYLATGKEVDSACAPEARFACVDLNVLEFRRAISNLIDNAVEAIPDKGRVFVSLSIGQNAVSISIADDGIGMSDEVLTRIGERGFSRGKANGSGLGVYYAKQSVTSWHGSLAIRSRAEGGTSVEIGLPRASAPWIKTELVLAKNATLAGLDDDPTIHAQLQQRLSEIKLPEGFDTEHFFNPDDFIRWFRGIRDARRSLVLLSDQHMTEKGLRGLDVIESLGISQHSVLVTSAFNDPHVVNRCKALGVTLLPKPLLAYVPIRFA